MIDKTCNVCTNAYRVPNSQKERSRFCSRACMAKARAESMRGNAFRAGLRPANALAEGGTPWNKGLRGVRCSPDSEFKRGHTPTNKAPIGAVRFRTHSGDSSRAWIKVSEPNTWRLRAVVVWESVNGVLPHGMIVHHRNRDTTDDAIGNLEAVSRAAHITEHRAEFEARRKAAASSARRER